MNRQEFARRLRSEVLILDGSMGAFLQARGLPDGYAPDLWNVEEPDAIVAVHREYVNAGADILLTNTFGASRLRLGEYGASDRVREINAAAVQNARRAIGDKRALVAGDIGPSGTTLQPGGELPFEEAVEIFAEQARALVDAGVDVIAIETMFDLVEMKAALIGVRDVSRTVPVIAHMTYTVRGLTDTGTDPETAAIVLEACGADVIGVNCSVGPEDMLEVVGRMARATSLPLSVQPNAGLPVMRHGRTVFPQTADQMAPFAKQFVDRGAAIVGGCCGTTPEYIRMIASEVGHKPHAATSRLPGTWITSRSRSLRIGKGAPFVTIGERINPTGRKVFSQAIREGRTDLIVQDARAQAEGGAMALDVNVGVPLVDEAAMLEKAVLAVQNVTDLPLVVDSANVHALERGIRAFPGRPLVNSVDPVREKADFLLPIIKRYGCAVIGMCAESEIPERAIDRVRNAEKILRMCEEHGIPKEWVVFDCISIPVSAAPASAAQTIETIRIITTELGCATTLGLSNVSFGIPLRKTVHNTFLAQAIAAGLDSAICNAVDPLLKETVAAASLFAGRDAGCRRYIDMAVPLEAQRKRDQAMLDAAKAGQLLNVATPGGDEPKGEAGAGKAKGTRDLLWDAVVEGDKDGVPGLVKRGLAEGLDPFDIFLNVLTPAIRHLGDLFGTGKKFIPHLIASADAMKAGVAVLMPLLEASGNVEKKGTVILATVKGDIHDIGKNIVGLMLRNFGFDVHDLGRNVPLEDILAAAREHKAQIIGLSALMTTTMMRMKDVIDAVRGQGLPHVVMIGGAVTTPSFAEEIRADGYGKDVGDVVAIAERMLATHKERFPRDASDKPATQEPRSPAP
ncbi:homocysteine S-methyltransferase family protein [Polyangium jinanense]|uniref:Methionine synthase n=1 Tax=Polyangium jinanense TaxID=2829994 RepID=A0A9X3X7N9_9BACT|nr:homocysteine S-methyltransferase family protein [Polyangium jinanense]MDC3983233.1 homocysteine S-methyltransferase family protein [Polyangium jinanense]MDC3985187.1 homocysteine S-methyltransferase family protein [Polyangium jinanense]